MARGGARPGAGRPARKSAHTSPPSRVRAPAREMAAKIKGRGRRTRSSPGRRAGGSRASGVADGRSVAARAASSPLRRQHGRDGRRARARRRRAVVDGDRPALCSPPSRVRAPAREMAAKIKGRGRRTRSSYPIGNNRRAFWEDEVCSVAASPIFCAVVRIFLLVSSDVPQTRLSAPRLEATD